MRTANSPLWATAKSTEIRRLRNYAVQRAGSVELLQGNPERAGQLVDYYDGLCRKVGLDTVLVVCQTWHETSLWTSRWFREYRNPAGIGVSGARSILPLPGYQYMPVPESIKKYMRGAAYPTYAVAAMAHVHGVAMWAGLPVASILDSRYTKYMYTPPQKARGSARTVLELGYAYNPRQIGWAHPGRALYVGKREIDAAEALALQKTYGHAIARLANNVLA